MNKQTYKTRQKKIILDFIQNNTKEFCAKDIYDFIILSGDKIGITTIYRILDSMIKEGNIKKIYNNDGIAYYQNLKQCKEDNHFYLKCNKCGEITHVDCDCIKEFSSHIINKHKFTIDNVNILISGICNKCKDKIEG